MTRTTWVEITCNECGCAEHFPSPTTNKWLETEAGYLISGSVHYCRKCRQKENKNNVGNIAPETTKTMALNVGDSLLPRPFHEIKVLEIQEAGFLFNGKSVTVQIDEKDRSRDKLLKEGDRLNVDLGFMELPDETVGCRSFFVREINVNSQTVILDVSS